MGVERLNPNPPIPVAPVAPVAPEAPKAPPTLKRKAEAVERSFRLTSGERSGMRAVRKLRVNHLQPSAQPNLSAEIIRAAKPATPRQNPSVGLLRLSGYFNAAKNTPHKK